MDIVLCIVRGGEDLNGEDESENTCLGKLVL